MDFFFCFFAPCGKVEAKVDRKHYQNPQTKIDYFYLAALLDLATGVGDRASSLCMQFCVLRNPSLPPSILAHSTPTLIQLASPPLRLWFQSDFSIFSPSVWTEGEFIFPSPPLLSLSPAKKVNFPSLPALRAVLVGGRRRVYCFHRRRGRGEEGKYAGPQNKRGRGRRIPITKLLCSNTQTEGTQWTYEKRPF